MYIKRTIEKEILKLSSFFPVVFIGGPRQVGKTTVFENCEEKPRLKVSLDIPSIRELAKSDPKAFFDKYPAPVLIDEVQYAPELFSYIKAIVDEKKQNGLFWLTGSQQFHLMKNVTESLAGRVGILTLEGLSQNEKSSHPDVQPFLPTLEYIKTKEKNAIETTLPKIYEMVWKGSYPKLYQADNDFWSVYYDSYIQTYLERDVKSLTSVQNELDFLKFMKILAARTSQELEYSSIADEIGISVPTVKSWLSILATTGVIYLLEPYYTNISKRLIKSPKIHFLDTGLACYLTGWNSPETLENGAMAGNMLESYVFSEILKSYWHNGKRPNIYYYRDKDKREIDILIEENGVLYPIEVKKKSNPDKGDIRAFKVIENVLKQKCGEGAVVCMANTYMPLSENVTIVPVGYL
ncbi:MAG: ATP-binding protein [Alphaproteobacteria bacterium]|nr:ATP-binding protein [Alphaproteobacteria bacterium]